MKRILILTLLFVAGCDAPAFYDMPRSSYREPAYREPAFSQIERDARQAEIEYRLDKMDEAQHQQEFDRTINSWLR